MINDECYDCPKNTYSAYYYSNQCSPCPNNMTTPGTKSSLADCRDG